MTALENETFGRIAEEFRLGNGWQGSAIELLAENDHKYLKDLRINLANALSYPNLSKKESLLIALAVAVNEKNAALTASFRVLLDEEGIEPAVIAEVYACVSLMNVNNVFYRFRHFTGKEYYMQTPAGIKMSIMMNPATGKEFFELLSLAISAVNGCEMCVNAHEASVLQHGASEARIYDAIRLASVIKGFSVVV